MFCPNCGSQNNDSAGFCASCGTSLKPQQAQSQPMASSNVPAGGGGLPPKTWLVESILVTLFCCLPFGIAGIVNASKVESKFASGDSAGALKASEEAAKWTKIGFFVGLGVGVLYFIFMIFVGVAGGGGF